MNVSIERARAAKEKLKKLLEAAPDVVGIGLSGAPGSYAVKVNLLPGGSATHVPEDIDGVPVRVERVGPIRKLPG
jgi:hypothetical protein